MKSAQIVSVIFVAPFLLIACETRPANSARECEPPPQAPIPPECLVPGEAHFDRGTTAKALNAVDPLLAECETPDGPRGAGHVSITFSPGGCVTNVSIDQPPYACTGTADCIAGKLAKVRIPSFSGTSVHAGKLFTLH